jgi:hypothetical protein
MIGTALVLLLAGFQSGYQYGGTFIGAVICDSGVVIASDSRTTFMDAGGRAFGYMDGMPKIYVDQGSAIAVAGLFSLEGELFSSFVNRNHDLLARPVNEILFGFLVWMPFTNSNGVLMISAGFQDGKPAICAKAPVLPQTCSSTGFISNKNSPQLRDMLTKLGRLPTAAEATAALKAAIQESSRVDPTVGGPVSILTLRPSAPPQWSDGPLTDGGLTLICDLVREHRAGRRRIISVGTPQELEQHLDAACPGK